MIRRHTTKRSTKSGFTIVEVSLATALLSVLLIAISVITVNIVNIYQKGTVMKNLNSIGRDLTDGITTAIEASLPAQTIHYGNWQSSVTSTYGDINTYYRTGPRGGVVCFGQYSYIWATPDNDGTYDSENPPSISYMMLGETRVQKKEDFRFVKIRDDHRLACANYNNYDNATDVHTYAGKADGFTLSEEPEELLAGRDYDMDFYIYDFVLNKVDGESSQNQAEGNVGEVYFSGYFTLGTKRGVNYSTELSNCKIGAEDSEDDFNYCAVNKFKFAARTAGKVDK